MMATTYWVINHMPESVHDNPWGRRYLYHIYCRHEETEVSENK